MKWLAAGQLEAEPEPVLWLCWLRGLLQWRITLLRRCVGLPRRCKRSSWGGLHLRLRMLHLLWLIRHRLRSSASIRDVATRERLVTRGTGVESGKLIEVSAWGHSMRRRGRRTGG